MNLSEYQAKARLTAVYSEGASSHGLLYTALGLAAETGEAVNILKKILRGDYGPQDKALERVKGDLILELGDVLWYIAALASEIDVDLTDIARANLDKLAARHFKE